MKRWVFNIFCALSLLVFVGSVTLWVRSYFVGEQVIAWETERAGEANVQRQVCYYFLTSRGSLAVVRQHFSDATVSMEPSGVRYFHDKPTRRVPWPRTTVDRVNFEFGGVAVLDQVKLSGNFRYTGLIVPLWLFLPAAIPPVLWWRRRRRAKARGFPVEMNNPDAGKVEA